MYTFSLIYDNNNIIHQPHTVIITFYFNISSSIPLNFQINRLIVWVWDDKKEKDSNYVCVAAPFDMYN